MRRSMMQPVNSNPWDWVEYLDLEKLQDERKTDSETDEEENNVPVGRIVDVSSCEVNRSRLDETPTSNAIEKVVSHLGDPGSNPGRKPRLIRDHLHHFQLQGRTQIFLSSRFQARIPVSSSNVSPEVTVGDACHDDLSGNSKKPPAGLHTSLDEVHHLPFSPDKWIFTVQASKYKYTFDHET
uniref:Uncharacterized protein n=1 Tax=Ditylenchus dipsaci TaxID=166011 RepID=A0A915EFG2_9BILA